ncbi:TraR/DksA C4-type zinc finger protein [Chitinimonas sp.]|uniref:TraR/DksA C4-type zinc finger protein n=1 Tax=Chitinimonas sp. TaxID=1934313 RepID=UPI0035ADC240
MTDPLDIASEVEEAHRAAALQVALANARRQLHDNASELCVMCEDPIPALRRAAIAGCRFCIDCQRRIETNPELRRRYA